MASKKAIFNYGGGKKDIKHSKYDMSNQQLFDSDFGELGVVGLYETLPDDTWKISENAMTLVKPMTAPAFTRIHQNYYSFYVRNSAVWKYWHDFITDGSAHNQVYGANNQRSALSGSWKVPCVRMNDIQMIAKIARGYAIPTVEVSFTVDISERNGERLRIYNGNNAVGRDVTDFLAALGSITDVTRVGEDLRNKLPLLRFISREVPYYQAICTSYENPRMSFRVCCGGSFYQLSQLRSRVADSDGISVCDTVLSSSGDTISRNSSSSSLYDISNTDFNFIPINWRFFQDEVNNDEFRPPFVHSLNRDAYMYDLNSPRTSSGNKYYRSYDFLRNDDNVGEFSKFGKNVFINGGENVNTGYNYGFYQFSNIFWGKKYSVHYGSNELFLMSYDVMKPGYFDNGGFTWSLPFYLFHLTGDFPDEPAISNLTNQLFDALPNYFGAPSSDYRYLLDGIHEALSSNVTEFCSSASDYHSIGMSPFSDFEYNFYNDSTSNHFGLDYSHLTKYSFDVIIPMLSAAVPTGVYWVGNSIVASYMRNDWLYSVGYTSDAWLIYLCKNSLRLLDGLGLTYEPLAARSFDDYKFERFNMLPAMCYSKVWDDFYRNRVTSSPELDFNAVNGFGFFDANAVKYVQTRTSFDPDVIPDWTVDVKPNSWMLDVNVRPMNGQSADVFRGVGLSSVSLYQLMDGSDNHFTIRNWFMLFSVLTGYGLREQFLRERFSYFVNMDGVGNIADNFFELSSLFADNFYLPQYYNGLLHLKYQNFNKDYFSSAMLDPLSGTDEVEIGDTVTSLRRAEIEQSMAEQVAQSRSVRDYYKRIFGNVPKLNENSAVFLGSDHIDVNIGQVIQTSQTTEDSAQGTRSGLGGAHGSGRLVKHHCDDHGFIFVLCSHTVESQYMNTYSKKLDVKDSYLDYPTVNYANIGNESIKIKELNYITPASQVLQPFGTALNAVYYGSVVNIPGDRAVTKMDGKQSPELLSTRAINGGSDISASNRMFRYLNLAKGTGTGLDNVFGFIPRYSTYKFEFDRVHGSLREQLQYWHSFRKFGSQPMLTHDFVNWELLSTDNDFDRLFATAADIDAKFVINLFLNAVVSRALPFVCVPKTKSN